MRRKFAVHGIMSKVALYAKSINDMYTENGLNVQTMEKNENCP